MAGPFPLVPHSRSIRISAVLVALLVLVLVGERLYVGHLQDDWEEAARSEAAASAEEIRSRFAAFQQETKGAVDEALARLLQSEHAPDGAAFELLASASAGDIALEFRDARKEVVAWSGNRGPVIDTARLGPGEVSFVLQGPIYSYLVVSLPAVAQGTTGGFLVGKRLFDVTFPINNRFISSTTFTSTFTSQLRLRPEFRFPALLAPPADTTSFSVDLAGIDGAVIGTAVLPRPSLSATSEAAHRVALQLVGMLAVMLVLVLAAGVVPALARRAPQAVRGLIWTLCIWGARYAFLWMEFPASLFDPGYFDPVYFASPFGFGLAQSLGDVFLSSLALFLNILAIVLPGFRRAAPDGKRRSRVRLFLISPIALLALALALAGVALLRSSFRIVRGAFPGLAAWGAWCVVAGAFLLLSLLFGSVYHHSLMSQEARAAVLVGGILLAAWVDRALEQGLKTAGGAVAFSLAAVTLLVLPLDATVHELDRNHVELMGREILRPVDSWLSFVINRSLDDIARGDAARILRDGDRDDVEKLAFTQWAKSLLSQEGNNCSVTFVDAEGSVVSDFHIGIAQQWFRRHPMDEMPRSNRLVEVDERGDNGRLVKWYRGYAPVFAEDSTFLGGVWVDLSGANQRMLRGESEEILRNTPREDFASHHRTLSFFEYYEGELVSSTVDDASLHAGLPAGVDLGSDSADGVWVTSPFGARPYEVYFLPDGSRGKVGSWIGLGMEELGLRWHLYAYLRYASFLLLAMLAFLVLFTAARVARGERPSADFRTKLLVAFLVVSLIPLVILAYYNGVSATERAAELTGRELARQTLAVAGALERTLGAGTPALVARISDEQCEELATSMDVDFNLYRGALLQATSKPEMFMAELLDHSLSAASYVNIVLARKNFYAERQTIGSLPYIVGYRPLVSENGRVIAVVSVPTLFSRNEIESELTERNAFLYGAYALALVLSVVVGSIFASQIASPVRRLKRATGELARGNMEISLRRSSSDELGDLEEAFAGMTSELKRTQEQMLKAQKELAWREMARQVAHEIKNPLTPMKLSVQHLLQAYRDKVPDFGDVLGRVSATVLEQIDALSRIASEFSSHARMPAGKPESVDVHEILQEAKNLFHVGGIRFVTELLAERAVVRADREELRRVFINILRNSVQAMGGSGAVTISTSCEGGTLSVRLRDTGPGIPDEVRGRLFELNFSTKTDGMGLGLTIVRGTLESLGGSIAIDSAPGAGTTVTITMPLLPA